MQYLQKYYYLSEDVRKTLISSSKSFQDTDTDLESKIKKMAQTCLRTKLDKHIKEKLENSTWLLPCINGQINKFPYRISETGVGYVLSDFYYPENQNTKNPTSSTQACPRFIVNIPDGRSPSAYPIDSRYSKILNRLKTQAFSIASSASSRMFKSRVAVVVGTNQVESLDPAFNRAFVELIRNTPCFSNIACRRFGFLWRPKYRCSTANQLFYKPKDSFFLLKVLSKTQAEKVRELVEMPKKKLHPNIISQIPFQRIRETVLESNFTKNFANEFQRTASSSPIYLTVMDPDFLSLRMSDGKGLFSKAAEITLIENPLSVIGAGYSTHANELPIIRLAVRIDMAVRAAMTRIIPYSAYLPEPFLCVLLRKPNQNHYLTRLSFEGRGRALESRRLIENGKTYGVLDDRMAFILNGLVTSSPERWKTKKNRSCKKLTIKKIKQKKFLQAIRGLSQSHVHPKKWADQVYSAINFSCSRVTDATTPMMRIYGVFDPISRMFAHLGHFTVQAFDEIMHNYKDPLSNDQKNLLKNAATQLIKLGMSALLVNRIIMAAKASGNAIYQELCKEVGI